MPSRLIRASLIAFILTAASITAAHAQTDWPQPGTHADYNTVEIITLANPGHRHYCRVHAITPDTIVCGVGLARKPVSYRRDDVAAILESVDYDPLTHSIEHSMVTSFEAGAITAAAIAAAIVAPWVSLALAASAITYVIYSAIHPHTTWHAEQILYQRPNTPLTVHLRTH